MRQFCKSVASSSVHLDVALSASSNPRPPLCATMYIHPSLWSLLELLAQDESS